MKYKKVLFRVIDSIFLVIMVIGSIFGVIYELLPNKSIVPDDVFNFLFIAQFIVIIAFVIYLFLRKKFYR